jgi:hypothetical protein
VRGLRYRSLLRPLIRGMNEAVGENNEANSGSEVIGAKEEYETEEDRDDDWTEVVEDDGRARRHPASEDQCMRI